MHTNILQMLVNRGNLINQSQIQFHFSFIASGFWMSLHQSEV